MKAIGAVLLWSPVMLAGLALLWAPFWIVTHVGLADSHPVIAFAVAIGVDIWLCQLADRFFDSS